MLCRCTGYENIVTAVEGDLRGAMAELVEHASAARPAWAWAPRAPRKEDDRLLRGDGRFTDDVDLPRTLHLAVARCPFPHARDREHRRLRGRARSRACARSSSARTSSRRTRADLRPAARPERPGPALLRARRRRGGVRGPARRQRRGRRAGTWPRTRSSSSTSSTSRCPTSRDVVAAAHDGRAAAAPVRPADQRARAQPAGPRATRTRGSPRRPSWSRTASASTASPACRWRPARCSRRVAAGRARADRLQLDAGAAPRPQAARRGAAPRRGRRSGSARPTSAAPSA